MNGMGRDWAIALGGILSLSLALSLVAAVVPGRQIFSELRFEFDRWKGETGPQEPKQASPVGNDGISPAPVFVPDQLPYSPVSPATVPPSPGAAIPKTNGRSWITNEDYPAEALRNNWQGSVQIEWTIDETGLPRDCKITQSSGYPVLDEAACNLIMRRARYWPTLDEQGLPVTAKSRRTVVWRIAD
jgi:TonB family protein